MPSQPARLGNDLDSFAAFHRSQSAVFQLPFAGRIGGNQEFTASDSSEKGREILKNQPDAAPLYSLRASLHPSGFLVYENYRMGVIEGLGTCLLVFAGGAGASGLTTMSSSVSPMAISLYAALLNAVSLSLFIFAAAPASGGHLNPSITMATFFAGLSTLPRSVIYIVAQTVGAIVGGYWLKLGLGEQYFPAGVIPGCTVDSTQVSPGQLFALEYMFALGLVFLAFVVGLDPRQGKVFVCLAILSNALIATAVESSPRGLGEPGPAFSPILVGAVLGFATLASSAAKPGYTGVSFNPARCMGLMVAKGEMQYHYIHWLGPLAASIINAVFYFFAPPYVRERPAREATGMSRNAA